MNPDSPMTPREELEMKLTALIMGELSPDETAAMQARMAADPRLAVLHARLRKAVELLREASAMPAEASPPAPVQLSRERRERLLAHFKTPPPKATPARTITPMPPRDWSWIISMGIAAALVALIGGSMFNMVLFKRYVEPSDFVAEPGGTVNADVHPFAAAEAPLQDGWASQPGIARVFRDESLPTTKSPTVALSQGIATTNITTPNFRVPVTPQITTPQFSQNAPNISSIEARTGVFTTSDSKGPQSGLSFGNIALPTLAGAPSNAARPEVKLDAGNLSTNGVGAADAGSVVPNQSAATDLGRTDFYSYYAGKSEAAPPADSRVPMLGDIPVLGKIFKGAYSPDSNFDTGTGNSYAKRADDKPILGAQTGEQLGALGKGQSQTGTLDLNGAGALILSGNNTYYTGATTINGGTLNITNGNTFAGGITATGSGAPADSAGIVKAGSGTLTLGGTSVNGVSGIPMTPGAAGAPNTNPLTVTGSTAVTNGSLVTSSANAPLTVVSGGTLQLNGGFATAASAAPEGDMFKKDAAKAGKGEWAMNGANGRPAAAAPAAPAVVPAAPAEPQIAELKSEAPSPNPTQYGIDASRGIVLPNTGGSAAAGESIAALQKDKTIADRDKLGLAQPGAPVPTIDNPIAGKLAFWNDDDASKLNINTGRGFVSDPAGVAPLFEMPVAEPMPRQENEKAAPVLNLFGRPRVSTWPVKPEEAPAPQPALPKTDRFYSSVDELLLPTGKNANDPNGPKDGEERAKVEQAARKWAELNAPANGAANEIRQQASPDLLRDLSVAATNGNKNIEGMLEKNGYAIQKSAPAADGADAPAAGGAGLAAPAFGTDGGKRRIVVGPRATPAPAPVTTAPPPPPLPAPVAAATPAPAAKPMPAAKKEAAEKLNIDRPTREGNGQQAQAVYEVKPNSKDSPVFIRGQQGVVPAARAKETPELLARQAGSELALKQQLQGEVQQKLKEVEQERDLKRGEAAATASEKGRLIEEARERVAAAAAKAAQIRQEQKIPDPDPDKEGTVFGQEAASAGAFAAEAKAQQDLVIKLQRESQSPKETQSSEVRRAGENRLRFEKDKLAALEQKATDAQGEQVKYKSKIATYLEAKNQYLEAKRTLDLLSAEKEPEAARRAPASAATPQPEVATSANAFSTFSLNVSDVAFKLAAASLEQGHMPDPSTIRSEEFINAFDYRDPEPAAGVPLAFASERARYPFAQNRDLLRLSVKTAAAGRQPGRPLNIVLLLDNSGSMERADRVRIVQEALRVLCTQLYKEDKLSIVTFSRTPRLWADGIAGDKAGEMVARVADITPQGGTNLGSALDLGYATALRHYQVGSINRVVLFTDGAANLGNVDPESLKKKVEDHRRQGVALDCFGIGWEGYDDTVLETLSRNGDGRYGFINSPEEAASGFAGQLAGALRVAASDVKVQVEFNPNRVTAYRQIGYAKHQLKKEQFRDNTVDAAEIGAAESGNALYVVEVNPQGEGDLATVRVRFKVPGTSDYREHAWPVTYNGPVQPLEQASTSLRLAGTASAFAEWLVGSPYAMEVSPERLLGLLNGVPAACGADPRPQKLEWMIRQAKSVSGR